MTRFHAALIAAAVLVVTVSLPRPAAAIEYPWCAQYGRTGDGGRNCGFSTLAQCMATVSGIGGDCQRNLFYEGPAERPAKPAKNNKSKKHDG